MIIVPSEKFAESMKKCLIEFSLFSELGKCIFPWVIVPELRAGRSLDNFTQGGVISRDAADREFYNLVVKNHRARTIIIHDPWASGGDVIVNPIAATYCVETSKGNLFIYQTQSLELDEFINVKDSLVSYTKFVYVLDRIVSPEYLAKLMKDGCGLYPEILNICVNCYDDESWSGVAQHMMIK